MCDQKTTNYDTINCTVKTIFKYEAFCKLFKNAYTAVESLENPSLVVYY